MARSQEQHGGVYMLTSKLTGDRYIGGSSNLESRLYQHRRAIINRKGSERYLQAFPNVDCVEFRVVEFKVAPDICAYGDGAIEIQRFNDDSSEFQAWVLEREASWILKLQPSLNIRGRTKRFSLDDVAIGPPEGAS